MLWITFGNTSTNASRNTPWKKFAYFVRAPLSVFALLRTISEIIGRAPRQAAAVFAQRDPSDSRTQLNSAINDISLAKSLARSGGFAEAETLFAAAEQSLRDVSKRGEDLQADYALADLDIRRGEMYVELARHDEARRLLERGLSGVKKVLAAMPDDENVQRLLADGTAALARAKG